LSETMKITAPAQATRAAVVLEPEGSPMWPVL
jgi:hypothetical protein